MEGKMKKEIFLIAFLLLVNNLFSQVEQHEVIVRNVVVPVRVLDGNKFVDSLTLEDFELTEDEKPQKIEALYLVQKKDIRRKEALQDFNPALSRHFYLLFQITEYNPKLAEAINYFFSNILLAGDSLTVMTPMDTYNLSQRALDTKPKDVISKELEGILRKDTQIGASSYRSLMTDLKRIVASITTATDPEKKALTGIETDSLTSMFTLDNLLDRYQETMTNLEQIRVIDEKKFIEFAMKLKNLPGQKNVFFFYQREFRPEISQNILNQLTSLHQEEPEILSRVQSLFQLYQRNPALDSPKIIASFADSSLTFNFIFMNKEPEYVSGVNMREQSEDIFNSLSQIAKATGGITDSSQNPAFAFKNAADLAESYYLLYYSPADYKKDGKFRSIKVNLKKYGYAVTHRIGYFAD
jgi:VWFA-related protein